MSDAVSPDLTAFREAKIERYCQLAAACALIYEYLITLDLEIDLFWKKRWTFGKAVFLFSRYYGLAFNTTNAIVFNQNNASLDWQNAGASIQVIVTHVMLELRLYAMYNSARWTLALFVIMTCGEGIMLGVVVGMPIVGLQDTNNPSPGLYICADGDPSNRHWISYYWTSLIIAESIFLGLALYKTYPCLSTGEGGNLMKVLTRDSVLYFIVIFGIYVANQVIWLKNIITLNEVATGFSFCITVILANRLMLAVRRRFYCPEDEYEDDVPVVLNIKRSIGNFSSTPRLRVVHADEHLRPENRCEFIELDAFEERPKK